jgi:NhaP-type Na+/H+ or K+/H+ antiporter
MVVITAFVVLVFVYSLISKRLEHTILTTPIVFTAAGVLLLLAISGPHELHITRDTFLELAEIGLVMLLFADATRVNLHTLWSREKLPLRLLSIGMLLTILLGTIAGLVIFPQLSLWEAGILAAILAPTDAGLGQVIVHSPRVPVRIRQTLDVEAGLNDGLSVPFLMFFIAVAHIGTEGAGRVLLTYIIEQLGLGALVGAAIGLIGGWLLDQARRHAWMDESVQQLGLVTLPILSILACEPVGGSMFIAAYVAGLAVQGGFRDASALSVEFIDGWGQLFVYFVFFLFGLLVALAFTHFSLAHALYAVLSLTVVRMIPVAVAVIGTRLSTATVLFMGWFGPRGLASIVLGLVFLGKDTHVPGEETIKLAVMVTVMLSIVAHGFSALPGIALYTRKVATLAATSPEHRL